MDKTNSFKGVWLPIVLLIPQLTITVIFFIFPAGQALLQSVYLEDTFGLTRKFVGLANFIQLFKDPLYLDSWIIAIIFSCAVTCLSMGSALLLAVASARIIRGAKIYYTFLIWPYAVVPAIAGVLWLFILNPNIGILTYLLTALGVHWDPVINSGHAIWMIILAASWKQISYNFLFFLAELYSIPKSLIEAAAIDGASPSRRFWTITFPLLSPISFFLLIINLTYTFFDTFGIIHAMTKGGPRHATSTLVYKIFIDGSIGMNFGSSAAQSIVLMLFVGLLTIIQFKYIEKRVSY